GWKLVEVARLTGGTDDPGELINPGSVAVDGSGRIYVAERDPSVIKQYAPDGTFLRTIGRQGSGPGEFQVPFIAIAGGHLYVQDPRQSRTSLFDTAGTYIRSWPSFCCYWTDLFLDSAGNVGVSGPPPSSAQQGDKNPYTRTVRWYRPDSTVADSNLIPAGPEVKYWSVTSGSGKNKSMMSTDIPWMPGIESTILPDHRVAYGFSDRYQIAITAHHGADTLALFGRQWTAAPISDVMRTAEVERRVNGAKKYWDERALRNSFLLSDVPSSAPAFDWIGLDGRGNLWVRTPLPSDSTRTLFDVFDPQYRWLGQVSGSKYLARWQARFLGDQMVGQGEDEDGNPVIVVYGVQRTEADRPETDRARSVRLQN
ncbi:MAG TPA: hypothetical protein VG940_06400, partial [Gemmatimonadales bacterium]|nr:hypothetical protein [Gemmatimonadales bacterium]